MACKTFDHVMCSGNHQEEHTSNSTGSLRKKSSFYRCGFECGDLNTCGPTILSRHVQAVGSPHHLIPLLPTLSLSVLRRKPVLGERNFKPPRANGGTLKARTGVVWAGDVWSSSGLMDENQISIYVTKRYVRRRLHQRCPERAFPGPTEVP